jgi:hypothetical protein
MDRETFEQLVCESLDQPERDDLRAAVEAAVKESPTLARLRDEWIRLDRLMRSAYRDLAIVDWARLRQRVSAKLGPAGVGEDVDRQLRGLTAVEKQVDWPRLRKRISQAVSEQATAPQVIRFPLRRVAGAAALLATAAVLVLMLRPSSEPPSAPAGFARVSGSPAADAFQRRDTVGGFARVTVSAPPDTEQAFDSEPNTRPDAPQIEPGEVFLMVEPVRVAARIHGSLNPFGFN